MTYIASLSGLAQRKRGAMVSDIEYVTVLPPIRGRGRVANPEYAELAEFLLNQAPMENWARVYTAIPVAKAVAVRNALKKHSEIQIASRVSEDSTTANPRVDVYCRVP